jgi:glycosyltransferase 2 family protein
VAAAVLFLCVLPIDARTLPGVEADAFDSVNDLPDSFYWPMWAVMQLGNLLVVPAVAIAALVARRFRLAAEFAVSGILVWLLAKVIKDLFERGRPAELLADVTLRHAPAVGHGFISGHAAVAAALAMVATPYLGRPWRVIVWVLAALVSIARVFVGAHLPLDVIGGAAFGIAVGALVHFVMGVPESRPRPQAAVWGSSA